jgi:hypothetical protein
MIYQTPHPPFQGNLVVAEGGWVIATGPFLDFEIV